MKNILRILALLLALLAPVSLLAMPSARAAEEDQARLVCLNIGKADCLLLLYGDDSSYKHEQKRHFHNVAFFSVCDAAVDYHSDNDRNGKLK